MDTTDKVLLGEINGIYGVQGWVKIFSHTDPRENILNYAPWWLHCSAAKARQQPEWHQVQIESGKLLQGKSVIAKLAGIDDREVARQLMGCQIWIEKSQLQPLSDANNAYYWVDLIGCEVVNLQQQSLGQVKHLMETGAHDVLRIETSQGKPLLIPFVEGHFIQSVDIQHKQIVVDWPLDEVLNEAEDRLEEGFLAKNTSFKE